MRAARGHWSRRIAKPGLTIEELTTDDTDRHGRKKEARGRMSSRISPGVESRRQNRTFRQKKLCDMSRTGCEGAMKTPENGRTNPSGGNWARYVTHYSEFRLGRESIADRGLTRCSLKMQQRISENSSVVRGQLSVEPGYRPVSVVSGQLSVVGRTETAGAAHYGGSDGERLASHGSASVTGIVLAPQVCERRPV